MDDVAISSEVGAALERLQPGWDSHRVVAVAPVAAGLSNANYALQYGAERFVLRVARDGVVGAIDRATEYVLLCDTLASVTAPLAAYCLPEGHLLTRYVDGSLLVDTPAAASAIASYVAGLHERLRPFGWSHPLPTLIERWLSSARRAGVEIPATWLDALGSLRTPPCLGPAHNDLNPWNVIVRGDSPRHWCTLDWEWCGDHSPLFDVVTLCEGLDLASDETREIVDRYCRERAWPRVDGASLDDLRLRFHLRECAWACAAQLRFGERPELEHQIARSGARLAALVS